MIEYAEDLDEEDEEHTKEDTEMNE